MTPETLWQSYLWSPGICWRCGAVTWVAACGTSHSAVTDTTTVLECCAPCLIATDQMHAARVAWQRRGIRPQTPQDLADYYVPAARSEAFAEQLREWVASLLVQLHEETVGGLVYGIRGRVTVRDAQSDPLETSDRAPRVRPGGVSGEAITAPALPGRPGTCPPVRDRGGLHPATHDKETLWPCLNRSNE